MTESKRGRPPKVEGAKRSAIAVRTTEEVKERITAAAEEAGRSLTQEIEQRLEWSLQFERELGGRDAVNFYRQAAARIALAEKRTGQPWLEDYATWTAAKRILQFVANDFSPAPPNIGAIYRATVAYNKALTHSNALWRELVERFPVGDDSGWAINALRGYDAGSRYAYRPDGTPRSEEEVAQALDLYRRAVAASSHAKELEAEVNKAEVDETAAKAAGLQIAQEIIAGLSYSRKEE